MINKLIVEFLGEANMKKKSRFLISFLRLKEL